MKRLCSYIVSQDAGLAPNPFWGFCTLAVCTPNHMGIKLEEDDWIVGFLNRDRGNRLLYAMKITEVLHFNNYYRDPRFKKKIPDIKGSWRQRCGDNFYFLDTTGVWKRHRTTFHRTNTNFKQDTKNPYVFVAQHFFYFGENAVDVPHSYKKLMFKQQGVKSNHSEKLIDSFIAWLEKAYKPGIYGKPIDNQDLNKKSPRAAVNR